MHTRSCSVDGTSKRVCLAVETPDVVELYYSTCEQIDLSSRWWQDDLALERIFEIKKWSVRVSKTLFEMFILDSWILYKV